MSEITSERIHQAQLYIARLLRDEQPGDVSLAPIWERLEGEREAMEAKSSARARALAMLEAAE